MGLDSDSVVSTIGGRYGIRSFAIFIMSLIFVNCDVSGGTGGYRGVGVSTVTLKDLRFAEAPYVTIGHSAGEGVW